MTVDLNTTSGIAPFICGRAATFIPHSSGAFIHNQGANPEPPIKKTVLLSKNRLHDFCYLTLFTFMRRSRTRRHMETKKVMIK